MADALSYIQLDLSGVDPGSIVFNANGDISYPARHVPLFPNTLRLNELEMRITLQSGDAGSFVNNAATWTSCDALTWPLCRATATRNEAFVGTTTNNHTVFLEVRRKLWTSDGVSGTFTLTNSAIIEASPLGDQAWGGTFLILEGMIEGSTYFAYVEYGFGLDGTLYKKRFSRMGGSTVLTNETTTEPWADGFSPSDLEIKIVETGGDPEGLFSNDFTDWVSGDNGGAVRLSATSNSAEPLSVTRSFDVLIRQKSQPTNVGTTAVDFTVSLVF